MKNYNEIKDYIRSRLRELKEEKHKKFLEKLCPDTKLVILGVKTPNLSKVVKEILKFDEENLNIYFKNAILDNNLYLEEVMILGMIIADSKFTIDKKISILKKYITKVDSWIVTDTVICRLKLKKEELPIIYKFIKKYLYNGNEFEVRFCVVVLLFYYINDEYIDSLLEIMSNIKCEKYYTQMAVAWTIAEASSKYYDKIIEYLKDDNKLSNFTYNKAIQKMIESNKISNDNKDMLRKMKIKY